MFWEEISFEFYSARIKQLFINKTAVHFAVCNQQDQAKHRLSEDSVSKFLDKHLGPLRLHPAVTDDGYWVVYLIIYLDNVSRSRDTLLMKKM